MSQVGVFVQATEIPPAPIIPTNTATAFVAGIADWGSSTTPTLVSSFMQAAQTIGAPSGSTNLYAYRSTTNAALFDWLETFFREGGSNAYIARVMGTSPVNASLVLQDNSSGTALTVTAQYPGVGGNGLFVAVNNTGAAYVVTLSDSSGNVLATSPSLSTNAAAVSWFAGTGYATAVAGAGQLAKTISATALAGGTNGGSSTLTNWTAALAQFGASLGPGQVAAAGVTNTGISGIWSALGSHAQLNNRVALCDMDDGVSAAATITALGSFGSSGVASYCGFWVGNLAIPGAVPGTVRSVAPSALIAGLCARVDAAGNPNQAAAGSSYPPNFVTGSATLVSGTQATYSLGDLYTLNSSGINTFANLYGAFLNYGFVSSVLPSADGVYWQFDHSRMRMALVAQAGLIGQPYVFAQMDGQGSQAIAFASALSNMLQGYYNVGALYGTTAPEAFLVDVGSDVNTPATIAAGQLNAACQVRLSPFAQMVTIVLNAVPITTTLPQQAAANT